MPHEVSPVGIDQEKDVERYKVFIEKPPGITVPGGTAARVVDFPPGYTSATHRTLSVNSNFVIEGKIEIVPDQLLTRRLLYSEKSIEAEVSEFFCVLR